jgi:hypothetical protein
VTHPSRDPAPDDGPANDRATFRQTLIRVMIVQIITVALLWLLQATYAR